MTVFHDPVIRIHGIKGARSACRVLADRPFVLLSPEHAAQINGAQWFADLVGLTRDEFPTASFRAILDCRGRMSGALTALEIGLDGVIIDPTGDRQTENLRDMGRQRGCQVFTAPPPSDAIYEMEDHRLPDHELDRRLGASLG